MVSLCNPHCHGVYLMHFSFQRGESLGHWARHVYRTALKVANDLLLRLATMVRTSTIAVATSPKESSMVDLSLWTLLIDFLLPDFFFQAHLLGTLPMGGLLLWLLLLG